MSKTERLKTDPDGKKVINKTDLQISKATERGIIHRDYLSHCGRWSHIIKWAGSLRRRDDFCVLDVGCGKEFPLLRTLYVNKIKPHYYLGCDIRSLNVEELHKVMTPNFEHEFNQCDFTEEIPESKYGKWDLIVFLEVIEHVSKENGIKILENINNVMNEETVLFMSTPCFNGKAAANHVYEWEYEELKNQLESMFEVEKHYGTFASQKDIEPLMDDCEKRLYEELKEYYDSNFMSIIFAPVHPDGSRNCIWRLKKKKS